MPTLKCSWSLGGDFIITDTDEDALAATLTLYPPLRDEAIDDPAGVAKAILEAMAQTPHPYASDGED